MWASTHTLRVRHCANHFLQTMVLVSKDSEYCLHVSGPPLMLLLQLEHPPLYCLSEACLLFQDPNQVSPPPQ